MKHTNESQTGYTLIELLVVIGVIALLVGLAIPNFVSARQRAVDSKTKQNMNQLKNALGLYYSDYGYYPPGGPCDGTKIQSGNGLNGMCGCGSGLEKCGGIGITDVSAKCVPSFALNASATTTCDKIYMKRFPEGFLQSSSSILYRQAASGDDFCLTATLVNKSDPDLLASQDRCSNVCGANCPVGGTKFCLCAD